jgi:DNA-binding transcriptional ArsR family regulator
MTPVEAADRELALVVAKLREWAAKGPNALAFAIAALGLEKHAHRHVTTSQDTAATGQRIDLLTHLLLEEPAKFTVAELAYEFGARESVVTNGLSALEQAGLVVQSRTEDGLVVWGCALDLADRVCEEGIRVLVSQVE